MGKRSPLILGFVGALIVIAPLCAAPSLGQDREKVVRVRKLDPSQPERPLELVDVTVAGASVMLDHPFAAGPEWIRDLNIRLRNISEKEVSAVALQLLFPSASEKDRRGTVLLHGRFTGAKAAVGEEAPVLPGEYLDMGLGEEDYLLGRLPPDQEAPRGRRDPPRKCRPS